MTDELRDLLERVATGAVAPDDAAAELRARASAPAARPVDDVGPVDALTVVGSGVRLVLLGDPHVATVLVEGPHRICEQGSRLVVDLPGEERTRPSWRFGGFRLEVPGGSGQRVRMRVNPALALRLELGACDAKVSGLRSDLDLDVSSSSLTIADHEGAVRGATTASSVAIAAVLRRDGELVCDMGSLSLALLQGSDATVTASVEMGTVTFFGGDQGDASTDSAGLRTTRRASTGSGAAAIGLRGRMGSIKVSLP